MARKVHYYSKTKDKLINNTFRLSKLPTVKGYTLDKESRWTDGLRIESTVLGKDMVEESSVSVENDGIYDLKLLNIDENLNVNIKNRFKDMTRDDFKGDDDGGYHTDKLNDIKSRIEKGEIQAIEPIIFDYLDDKKTLELIDGHHRSIIANELGLKQIYAYVRRLEERK